VIPASYGAKKRGRQVDYELEVQFNSIRTQLRNVQSKHEVLKRMKENINKHQQCLQAREKQRIETEVLNDYNYLRAKTRKDNERAKSSLSNSFSLDATPESGISMISGESDSDRFYRKWEKIIKSGMESDTSSLNPYAVQMLPKEDPKI